MKFYTLSPRAAVIEAATRAGAEIVPVCTAAQMAGFTAGITVSNTLDAVELCRVLIANGAQEGDANCLCVGLGDASSQTAALVNSALSFAGGQHASVTALERMRDKLGLRTYLGDTCPYNGRFWLVESVGEVTALLADCPNGAVLKPLDGSGSRGVLRLDQTSDLQALSFETPMLLEERFIGPEYSVESISWDGKHHSLVVTEKQVGGTSGLVEIGQLQPARISPESKQNLFNAAGEILTAVKYRFGLSHFEFILQDGAPKLVEAHGRIGGDRIADLMQWSIGRDGFELLFRAYVSGDVDVIVETGTSAQVVFPDLSSWKDTDEAWLKMVHQFEGVAEAKILRDRTSRGLVNASSDRHAQVVIAGQSTEDTAEKIRNLGAL